MLPWQLGPVCRAEPGVNSGGLVTDPAALQGPPESQEPVSTTSHKAVQGQTPAHWHILPMARASPDLCSWPSLVWQVA